MLHQREEERQIGRLDAALVEREDVTARLGAQQIVGVLDPLGDALARAHLADRVLGDEGAQLVIGNVGIDRHLDRGPAMLVPPPLVA
jgi:hypothetical protein